MECQLLSWCVSRSCKSLSTCSYPCPMHISPPSSSIALLSLGIMCFPIFHNFHPQLSRPLSQWWINTEARTSPITWQLSPVCLFVPLPHGFIVVFHLVNLHIKACVQVLNMECYDPVFRCSLTSSHLNLTKCGKCVKRKQCCISNWQCSYWCMCFLFLIVDCTNTSFILFSRRNHSAWDVV